MEGRKKLETLSFSDCSGGCNSIDHGTSFNQNQVHDSSVGWQLRKSGIVKYPGIAGLTNFSVNARVRLLTTFRDFEGTETLYCISGGTVFEVIV